MIFYISKSWAVMMTEKYDDVYNFGVFILFLYIFFFLKAYFGVIMPKILIEIDAGNS